ncbi:hypothetical protein EV193_103571 [Herbihabitans rhizosphaerae]|uniref:Uncharacterized protein n=1 Tax=Herbihabitans rhizosphaerae TaxID=1872711 RepID=A0A4Q7KY17_9PSEU|nr:hypothetical protein [Herbihabitans rhizosphaerae]RZS41250.1 hypothetical protein EV193_103571 [Herbihabitans rhizosphaerae]
MQQHEPVRRVERQADRVYTIVVATVVITTMTIMTLIWIIVYFQQLAFAKQLEELSGSANQESLLPNPLDFSTITTLVAYLVGIAGAAVTLLRKVVGPALVVVALIAVVVANVVGDLERGEPTDGYEFVAILTDVLTYVGVAAIGAAIVLPRVWRYVRRLPLAPSRTDVLV